VAVKPALLAALLGVVAALATPEAAAAAKVCDPVRNPYAGTRYEGVDLTRIRALEVSCSWARTVAKRAHRKALGMPLPADGIRRLKWRGWNVTGDLRPEIDRYVARKGDRRVRWRF
jgi:hypothetical protein